MIEIENLRSCLKLDYEKFHLYWMDRSDIAHNANQRLKHTRAFTSINKNGYFHGRIKQKSYLAHRVIWALHYGVWPDGEVDHINGNRLDNSIENLRLATASQNRCNRGKQKNNTSGYKGVFFNKKNCSWYAEIRKNGKKVYLGGAKSPLEAHKLYENAVIKYHGEFSNTGVKNENH